MRWLQGCVFFRAPSANEERRLVVPETAKYLEKQRKRMNEWENEWMNRSRSYCRVLVSVCHTGVMRAELLWGGHCMIYRSAAYVSKQAHIERGSRRHQGRWSQLTLLAGGGSSGASSYGTLKGAWLQSLVVWLTVYAACVHVESATSSTRPPGSGTGVHPSI